jgi:hypothetical protein
MKIRQVLLQRTRTIWNIDGTHNKAGSITHYVDLQVRVGAKVQDMRFLVTDIGEDKIILGYPWLAAFKPIIDWKEAVLNESMQPLVIKTLGLPIEDEVTQVCKVWIRQAKTLATPGEEIYVSYMDQSKIQKTSTAAQMVANAQGKEKTLGSDSPSTVPQMEEGLLGRRGKMIPRTSTLGHRNQFYRRCTQDIGLQNISPYAHGAGKT